MSDKESEPESIILNDNAYNEIRLTDVKEIQIIGMAISYLDACHYLKIKLNKIITIIDN